MQEHVIDLRLQKKENFMEKERFTIITALNTTANGSITISMAKVFFISSQAMNIMEIFIRTDEPEWVSTTAKSTNMMASF